MKRILVTGGAGFIGSHLVEKLIQQGYFVDVIDDLSNGNMENLKTVKQDIDFIRKDISIPGILSSELDEKYDVIYNLACHPRSLSFDYPFRDTQVNVLGMINVLEYAKKYKTKVIFSSNSGIYDTDGDYFPIDEGVPDKPKSPYDANKLSAEWYCKLYNKLYNIPYIIFRFATVYGPRQRVTEDWKPVVLTFIENCLNNKVCEIHGAGTQTRDFIYVDDIVNALLKAKDVSGIALNETMILGTGIETDIAKLYHLITMATGSKIDFIETPGKLGDILRMCYPSDKARFLLEWKPKISLEEGITKIINWYLEK